MTSQTTQFCADHAQTSPGTSELGDAISAFGKLRPRLFRIAYRLRGNVGEAEDIVQDAWIRWQTCDRSSVRNVPAFLSSLTLRLSINAGKSARARHEKIVGQLPEQMDSGFAPELAAERVEEIEAALRLTLERLSPNERAAFLLREVFDYSYEQIAVVIQQANGSARQLVCRARKHLATSRHIGVTQDAHQRLLEAFILAARTGDMRKLEILLVDDVVEEARMRRSNARPDRTLATKRPVLLLTP